MKKNLIAALLAFCLLLYPSSAGAQEDFILTTDTLVPGSHDKKGTEASPAAKASGFPPTKPADYDLPCPGILPDSPIYILKTIRDKIAGFIISSPLKKAEFDIDKADVRMSAARDLIEQKKDISLAETTISKAGNYFEEALANTREAKDQGIDIQDLVKRLALANRKHQEIISEIEKKIDKKDIEKFELVKKRIQDLSKTVE